MPEENAIHYRPVEVVDLKSCSHSDLVERFFQPGIPCIIENLFHESPAHQKWTREFFLRELGQERVRYHRLGEDRASVELGVEQICTTGLAEFIRRIEDGERIKHYGLSHPLYDLLATEPTLKQDINLSHLEQLVPPRPFFGLSRFDSRFWPLLPSDEAHFFIAGPATMTPCHYNPDHSDTFHWCVWGHKSVKLFAAEQWGASSHSPELFALHHDHLSNPVDQDLLSRHPRLAKLSGWEATLKTGQSIFIPSKMYHAFKNVETSMSYVVRARTIDSLESYCDFLDDATPPEMLIRRYAPMWRALDRRHRTFLGNLMAQAEEPLVKATRVVFKLLRLWVSLRKRLGLGTPRPKHRAVERSES